MRQTRIDARSANPGDEPWLIAIAASAGGIQALKTVLGGLPRTLQGSIVIVQHRMPKAESMLEKILARSTEMPVTTAKADERIEKGVVYIARPDFHLTVGQDHRFAYVDGTRVRGVRSSANPLFESVAEAFGPRAIAVVLTGSGFDATDGVQRVKSRGGMVIAQDPDTAEHSGMPASAIQTGAVDAVLPLEAIAPALVAITHGQSVDV